MTINLDFKNMSNFAKTVSGLAATIGTIMAIPGVGDAVQDALGKLVAGHGKMAAVVAAGGVIWTTLHDPKKKAEVEAVVETIEKVAPEVAAVAPAAPAAEPADSQPAAHVPEEEVPASDNWDDLRK